MKYGTFSTKELKFMKVGAIAQYLRHNFLSISVEPEIQIFQFILHLLYICRYWKIFRMCTYCVLCENMKWIITAVLFICLLANRNTIVKNSFYPVYSVTALWLLAEQSEWSTKSQAENIFCASSFEATGLAVKKFKPSVQNVCRAIPDTLPLLTYKIIGILLFSFRI